MSDAPAAAGEDLLGLVDASGVTVRLGGTALAAGSGLGLADADAGALAVRVGDSPDRYVLWTRPEWQREVAWAGDPRHQKAQQSAEGSRLSPRSSFEVWVERVGLRSRPWDPADLDEAFDLGRGLSDLVLRRAFERSEVTAALQRTLLLEGLPVVRGIESAMRYLPGGNQPVGGDWFELLSLPDDIATALVAVLDPTDGRVAPGEVLVLYSDRLIERRGQSIDDGLRRLREAAAALPAEPEALCQGLVERLAADGRPDDVTVLAVRRA